MFIKWKPFKVPIELTLSRGDWSQLDELELAVGSSIDPETEPPPANTGFEVYLFG
jgi:hypothetical protein